MADLAVQDDVRVDVQVRAGLREVVVGGLDRGRPIGEADAVDHRRSPADEEDVGGFEEHAAPELGRALASDDLDLVRVVMEDPAEALLVHLAQGHGDRLREAVRDAVGMADPLSLDDLIALLLDRRMDEFLDEDVPRHGIPPTAVRRGCPGPYITFVRNRSAAETSGAGHGIVGSEDDPQNNIRLRRKFRQEYVPAPHRGTDDAGPRRDPSSPEGAGAHADRDRPPRERQPVDDRQDREAADEPVLRQRAADHERAPGGAEAAGEAGPRRTDSEPEGAGR